MLRVEAAVLVTVLLYSHLGPKSEMLGCMNVFEQPTVW